MIDIIVFSDFDGTITAEETFAGAMMRVCDEDKLNYWVEQFKAGTPMGYCWSELFKTVPSLRYARIEEYLKQITVRRGFGEFVDYLWQRKIPLVVISGGIFRMQQHILAPYADKITGMYGCNLDTTREYMHFSSEYEAKQEYMSKLLIMEKYPAKKKICIGDSFTDFCMASASDVVFARDVLAQELEKLGRDYVPYETFFDVISGIEGLDRSSNFEQSY